MEDSKKRCFEDATPNPEFLIKSIAEQGYSLETALADLMDNSISALADRIEILIDMGNEPFTLYLADNGSGMSEDLLKAAMQFPSSSPEFSRTPADLGRFGLGMKTASFSQTRKFTVLSRKNGEIKYKARTWDVELLKNSKWRMLINSDEEIAQMLSNYDVLSGGFINQFEKFEPNTIIIWQGLYKFEKYIEDKNRQSALKKELTEVTSEHLSLVFHRFMERKERPLQIRINNTLIVPFNPFPTLEKDFRPIEYKQRVFGEDSIKIEGFVLPSRCISEVSRGLTIWTTKNRGLMDMEGVYIYRADRIILFGGWNGVIKKASRLQLARLRVEIGNNADHLLNLNVAKSQVIIPHDLKPAFQRYIDELKVEAEREFYNRGVKKFSNREKKNKALLFEHKATNKGLRLEINSEFPLYSSLVSELSSRQLSEFKTLMRMVNTTINDIKKTHEPEVFSATIKEDGVSIDDLLISISTFKESGLDNHIIRKVILPKLGYSIDTLPDEIIEILK